MLIFLFILVPLKHDQLQFDHQRVHGNSALGLQGRVFVVGPSAVRFSQNFKPPITRCPVKRGIYTHSNYTLDFLPFLGVTKLLRQKYLMKVSFSTEHPKPKGIMCIIFEFTVGSTRRRRTKG
jgi:hypothetical protein